MGIDRTRPLSIGALSERTGVAASALRYYEELGLIHAERTDSGQRRFARSTIRRVSFVRVAQRVGLSLEEIAEALSTLPVDRAPDDGEWARLSEAWRPRLDEQIRLLEGLRDDLDTCIGCGCLSVSTCGLLNPGDRAAELGVGPRYLLGDRPESRSEGGVEQRGRERA